MFSEAINRTEVVSYDMDELFVNANVDNFQDAVFTTMVRCLIYPRLGEESIYVAVNSALERTSEKGEYIEAREREVRGKNAIFCGWMPQREYSIHMDEFKRVLLSKGYEERVREANVIKCSYKSRTPLEVMVFRNNEKHITHVFSNMMNLHLQHVYSACIGHLFPWVFLEKPFSEDEIELIKSVAVETTPEKFLQAVKKIANGLGLKESRIKRLISIYETHGIEKNIENERAKIRGLYEDIRRYKESIEEKLDKIDEVSTLLLGFESRLAALKDRGGSALESVFMSDNITLNSAHDALDFTVFDHLSYFDKSRAKSYLDNTNSSFHSFGFDKELLNILVNDVFISRKPRVRIKMCARYIIKNSGSVRPVRMEDEVPYGFIENPHIKYHSCLGQHERYIVECMENGNTIGAVAQCMASCGSVNLGEGDTASYFIRDIFSNSGFGVVCFELPDGSVVNAHDAAIWLKENKVEDTGHEQEDEADDE